MEERYTSRPLPLHPPHPGTRREARKQIKAAVERRHPVLVGRLGNALIFRPVFSTPYVLHSPSVINGSSSRLAAKISRDNNDQSYRRYSKKKKKKKGACELRETSVWDAFLFFCPGHLCVGRGNCDKKAISLQIES